MPQLRRVLALGLVVRLVSGEAFGAKEGDTQSLADESLCRTTPPLGWKPEFHYEPAAKERKCAVDGGEETLQSTWGATAEGVKHGFAVDAYAIRQHQEVEVLMLHAQAKWGSRYDLDRSCGSLPGDDRTFGGAKGEAVFCEFADNDERTPASLSDDQSQFWARTQAVRCKVPDGVWKGGRDIAFKVVVASGDWSVGPFVASLPLVDQCTKPAYTDKGGSLDAAGKKTGDVPLLRYKLSLCTSAMTYITFNHYDGIGSSMDRLWEWIEYHRNLGVEHFFVYDHSAFRDKSTDAYKILQSYMADGVVTVVQWFEFERAGGIYDFPAININGKADQRGSTHSGTAVLQELQINHCLRKFGPYVRWFASYDTDEYFVPLRHPTLQGALKYLEDKGTIAEVTGTQKVFTCLNREFAPDVPVIGRCVFDSPRPITEWSRRWCCSKYWARADMTLFAGTHVPFSFYDTGEKECRTLACPRRFISVSDDGGDRKSNDNVLVEYLHYKHYETCKDCKDLFRSRQFERFGRLVRTNTLARKQQALGPAAAAAAPDAAGAAVSLEQLDKAGCAGSCRYNMLPGGFVWHNQPAWKRAEAGEL